MGRKLLWLFTVCLKRGSTCIGVVLTVMGELGVCQPGVLNRQIPTTSRPGGAPEFERAPSQAGLERATGWDGPRSPLCRFWRSARPWRGRTRDGAGGCSPGPAKCHEPHWRRRSHSEPRIRPDQGQRIFLL